MKIIKSFYKLLLLAVLLLVSVPHVAYSQRVGRWEKLGERTVNLSFDRDVIRCAHKGSFSTLRFHVSRAPVSFLCVVVRYVNGATDNLNFNQLVRSGKYFPYPNLRGGKRVICEIVVYYKAEKKSLRHRPLTKRAVIQVWGRL